MKKDISAHRIIHTDQIDVWVYDGRNKLILYDEHFRVRKTVRLPSTLFGMTMTASKYIIATDYDNECLINISPSGDVNTLCSTAPLTPLGICCNDRGNIVVGMTADWETPPFKLAIYSPDGSTLLQEIENDDDGKPLFRKGATRVKQSGNGDYVVADWDRVVCVSNEGKLRWDYRVGPSGIYGMVCDKYDNVIIAENYSIHLLSSEGKLVTTLLTAENGISFLWAMSIDRHGQLWIGKKSSIRVIKYLK